MLVLDTDHLSELDRGSAAGDALARRLAAENSVVATTVISAEEQLRGWLAQIHAERDPHQLMPLYQRLQGRIRVLRSRTVLQWGASAAEKYLDLRSQRIRVATMDLRIASIVLTCGATLLSRNLVDFRKVPGLIAEDWLT